MLFNLKSLGCKLYQPYTSCERTCNDSLIYPHALTNFGASYNFTRTSRLFCCLRSHFGSLFPLHNQRKSKHGGHPVKLSLHK